jgi:hypothetical protein
MLNLVTMEIKKKNREGMVGREESEEWEGVLGFSFKDKSNHIK